MPTYVMLTTLGPDGWSTVREQPERIREVTREVEGMGVKVVAQYGLLGQWDFLNVIEAPDEASLARAAISLASRGTMRTKPPSRTYSSAEWSTLLWPAYSSPIEG